MAIDEQSLMRLPLKAIEETPSSIWGHLMKTNAFERYGFDEDEASLIIGHQLGSNFVVSRWHCASGLPFLKLMTASSTSRLLCSRSSS